MVLGIELRDGVPGLDSQMTIAGSPQKKSLLIPFCGRYVFRHEITTPETREKTERAVGAKAAELNADWPGHVFTLPNNTYTALLGTFHGKGVVHLLMQHASGLPGKDIESITIFTTPDAFPKPEAIGWNTYHLFFTLTGW